MINPFGGVACVLGVDDVAIVQMKIESVVGLADVVRVAGLSFLPGNDLALVLQYLVAGLEWTDGVYALAWMPDLRTWMRRPPVDIPDLEWAVLAACLIIFSACIN